MYSISTIKSLIEKDRAKFDRTPLLAMIVIGLLTLWTLIHTITALKLSFTPPPTVHFAPVTISHTASPPVSSFHLFGQADSNLNSLPQTHLQLTLQGVMLALSPDQSSRAIINSAGTGSKVYQVGQTVPGGAVIKAIQQNQVILEEGGQLESLKLPIPQLTNGIYTKETA